MTFLASKDASYITGSDIPVCGGYLTVGPEQMGENSVTRVGVSLAAMTWDAVERVDECENNKDE